MIKEIEEILSSNDIENQSERKGGTQKIGEKYGLNKNMVARYLRINKLIEGLKKLIDEETISISTGAILSTLSNSEQIDLLEYLDTSKSKITVNHAQQLKTLSQKKKLTSTTLLDVFEENKPVKKDKSTAIIKVSRKNIQSYFKENEAESTIESTILEALEQFKI